MAAVGDLGLNVGETASSELHEFMKPLLPYAATSVDGVKIRKQGFRAADPNGNGLCSLAELETWVLNVLMKEYPKDSATKAEPGRDLWSLFRPCYVRAFNDAKDYKADTGKVIEGTKKSTADDFVSKGEFRLFCAYACIYAAMYDAFSKIDGGGAGRGGDDRKIDLSEWLAGYRGVTDHGFVGLKGLSGDAAAELLFMKMDNNGGGVVVLEEWCSFLKKAEIAAGTQVGQCLNEDEPGGAAQKPPPPPLPLPLPTETSVVPPASDQLSTDASQPPPPPPPLPPSKDEGAATAVASTAAVAASKSSTPVNGEGPTAELEKFKAPFLPFGAKTDASAKLRVAAFRAADPNGNGLCSLAELETWILNVLMKEYPKDSATKAEPGRDLWSLFRPCYVRAFNDAKDYKADTGKVIEGTKKSTADDFVSKGEFRVFNAMLVVYASMYDAFSKIDGGGAGRGGDDRKIDLSEWLAGYRGIRGYGFDALKALSGDAAAELLFMKIDANRGGVIILSEFCDFLKGAEVKAGTAMGLTLAEEEDRSGTASASSSKGEKASSSDAAAAPAEAKYVRKYIVEPPPEPADEEEEEEEEGPPELAGETLRFLKMFRLDKYAAALEATGEVTDLASLRDFCARSSSKLTASPPEGCGLSTSDASKLETRCVAVVEKRNASSGPPTSPRATTTYADREEAKLERTLKAAHVASKPGRKAFNTSPPKPLSVVTPTATSSSIATTPRGGPRASSSTTPTAQRPQALPEVEPELRRFLTSRRYQAHCQALANMGLMSCSQLLDFCSEDASAACAAFQDTRDGLGLSKFAANVFVKAVASASDPQSLKSKSGNAAASQFSVDFQEAALERKSRKAPSNKKAFDLSIATPLDARPHSEKPAAAPEVNPELKRFLFARKYGGHCRNLALMGLTTPDQLLEFCQSCDAAVALQNSRTGLNLSSFEASVFIKAVASSKDPDSLKSLKKFQEKSDVETARVQAEALEAAKQRAAWIEKKKQLKGGAAEATASS